MPTDKQRRETERRRLQRQLERRREREVARRRLTLIVSIVGTVVVIGIVVGFIIATGNDHKKPTAKSPTPSVTASPTPSPSPSASAAAYLCTWMRGGAASKKAAVPPTTKPSRKGTVNVAVQTSQGPLTFTLDRAAAPCAVESFVSLTRQKYFDSTSCHRLTSGGLSVLQCGDPTGTGKGGPGYSFGDELTGKERYTRGVLAMANGGPDTNGSQFFIVYKNSTLAPSYTVFGKLSKGLGVIDKVAAKGSTPASDGKPNLPVTIMKATVGK